MKNINKKLTILILFLTASVFAIDDIQVSEQQRLAYETINNFAEEVRGKGLKLAGIGGASRKGKKTGFELVFNSERLYKIDEIPEARAMLLKLMEDFLSRLNNNEKISSSLFQHPFPRKNIRIGIVSYVPYSDKDIYLQSFGIDNDRLEYSKPSEKEVGPTRTLLEETYEEALKIVAVSHEDKLNFSESK